MHIPLKTYLESIPGFFGIRTEEEPHYNIVVEDGHGFEVRRYDPLIQARTKVSGEYEEAMDEGFRRLAGYIFGDNSRREQFSMTTPVLEQKEQSETLPMTTPVLQTKDDNGWQMAFVLPSNVTHESAPIPQDHRVELVDVPAKMVATLRYTGNQTRERQETKALELLELVRKNGFVPRSEVYWAQYDQPWAIPFLKRNEAHVEVERMS